MEVAQIQALLTYASIGLITVGIGGAGFVLLRNMQATSRRRSRLAGDIAAAPSARGAGFGGGVLSETASVVRRLGDRIAMQDPSQVNQLKAKLIQAGFYQLKHKMSAKSALAVLVDPANLMQHSVTIPEGWTVKQIVAQLAKKTHFSARQYDALLQHPSKIGLPGYAHGKPEGYLYPATYEIPPNATPRSGSIARTSHQVAIGRSRPDTSEIHCPARTGSRVSRVTTASAYG